MHQDRKQLFTYLALTLAISSIFYFLVLKSGHLASANGMYVTGLMWSPAAAALLTCRLFRRDLGSLGWKWGNWRYQVMSYVIPLFYASITYGAIWLLGLGGFYNHTFLAGVTQRFGLGPMPAWASMTLYFALAGTTVMVGSCARALGEEIGWRGFLVPQLAKMTTFTKTAFISGIIWSLWHYPILIFGDYNAGTPTWYGLTCFTVMVVSISFVFAWMRLKSGSLWTGVLLHASHNLFIQGFFTPLTTDTGRTRYYVDEFGAGLAIVCIFFGAYFWRKRNELGAPEKPLVATAG